MQLHSVRIITTFSNILKDKQSFIFFHFPFQTPVDYKCTLVEVTMTNIVNQCAIKNVLQYHKQSNLWFHLKSNTLHHKMHRGYSDNICEMFYN